MLTPRRRRLRGYRVCGRFPEATEHGFSLRQGAGIFRFGSQRILRKRLGFILQGHRIENADLHA